MRKSIIAILLVALLILCAFVPVFAKGVATPVITSLVMDPDYLGDTGAGDVDVVGTITGTGFTGADIQVLYQYGSPGRYPEGNFIDVEIQSDTTVTFTQFVPRAHDQVQDALFTVYVDGQATPFSHMYALNPR